MKLWHINAPGGAEATERPHGSGRYHFGDWVDGSAYQPPCVPLWALKQHGWSETPLANSITPAKGAKP